MNQSDVLVSVILPSYNHALYIGKAIDSVLSQSFTDFEFLISDDASTDNTKEIIQKYNDPRIHTNFFDKNQGAALNGDYLLQQVKGKYVALINSDDLWLPGRLEAGVDFLEKHPDYGACFSEAQLIDENDTIVEKNTPIFSHPKRTQAEWVERLFTGGNCLCHPSLLIRSEIYRELGAYSLSMRQLPDFDMWVRVVKKYNIYVIPKVLVAHRRFLASGENTSSPILSNSLRDVTESFYILNHFFDGMENDLFVQAFQKYFRKKRALTNSEICCEKFFLLLDGYYYMKPISIVTAIQYFLSIYNVPGMAEVFQKSYNFSVQDFHKISCKVDMLGMVPKDYQVSDPPVVNYERFVLENKAKSLGLILFKKDSKVYNTFKKMFFFVNGK